MKSRLLVFGFVCIFLIDANSQNLSNRVSELQAEIDSMLTMEMESRKIPGLVYGIFSGDSLICINALGYADVQHQVPAKPESIFELASITKQFTASAILILQQDGKLNIHDKISQYFSECPEEWKEITIVQLLNHTSGLPGLYSNGGFNKSAYSGIKQMPVERVMKNYQFWDKEFQIDAIKTDQLIYSPGENHVYSDVGYSLLGIIIDNISGSYRDFLHDRIFTPVGMNSTYIIDQQIVRPMEARGYSLKDGILINIQRTGGDEIPSHYGVFSSVIDMQKWDAALNTNSILSAESKELLWTNYKLVDGISIGYGLGWKIFELGNKKLVSHTGITGTEILKLVEDEITICVLTNLGYNGNDRVNSWGLTTKIGSTLDLHVVINRETLLLDGKKPISFDHKTIKNIVGDYLVRSDTLSIYSEIEKVYLVSQLGKWELALLANGHCVVLGLKEEFILKPLDKRFNKILLNTMEGIKLEKE